MLYNFFDNELKIKQGIKSITYSYIILGLYTLNNYGVKNLFFGYGVERIGNDISQVNILGMSLASGAVLCFYFALYKKRNIYYLYFIFLFLMSSFTESRKALLSVLIGIIILVFLRNRMKSLLKTFLLVVLAITVLYILLKLPIFEGVLSRFNGLFDSSKPMEASALIRENMIRDGINYFTKKPMIGYGYDCFRELGYGTYSHNNYIEMLINGGIISFIIYYSLYLYIIIKLIPNIYKFDSISIIFFTMIVIQLIMDFAQVSYYSKIIYVYFALYFSYINMKGE
ncbi:O-antigen ligase family protein [Clostridium perfringens]|nr:O-antigen ligase family protein [Clostridium perfringens]